MKSVIPLTSRLMSLLLKDWGYIEGSDGGRGLCVTACGMVASMQFDLDCLGTEIVKSFPILPSLFWSC